MFELFAAFLVGMVCGAALVGVVMYFVGKLVRLPW